MGTFSNSIEVWSQPEVVYCFDIPTIVYVNGVALVDSQRLEVIAQRIPTVRLLQSITDKILWGRGKPEVGFLNGSPCDRRDFSVGWLLTA